MSGHSRWSTVKRKKAKVDAEKGKAFTRLIKDITIAARESGGDESANPKLRSAIAAAKAAFSTWRDTDPRDRAEYVFKTAAQVRKIRYELAALQVHEVGKNWTEADAGVCHMSRAPPNSILISKCYPFE